MRKIAKSTGTGCPLALLALFALFTGCGEPADSGPSLEEQGCDPSRAATGYLATASGSVALDGPVDPGAAGYGCLSLTGHGANEPALGVAADGTLYFSPATTLEGNGIAISRDQGASWELSIPEFEDGGGHPKLQPFFYLDPATERLFFATSKLVLNGLSNFVDDPGVHLSMSADGGDSWSYQAMSPEGRDWQKIFAGPPATSDPSETPNVLYYTIPSPIAGNWGGIYEPPDFQHFYKSLDNGDSWTEVSQLPIDPASLEGCTDGDYAMFGQGSVDAEGTIYLGHRRCQQLAVTVSRDEGDTWETHQVTGAKLPPYDTSSLGGILSIVGGENAITGEPITVDDEGNLYAVWADRLNDLYYASSTDGGESWSKPVQVMAPEVRGVRMVSIAAKEPGTVAIAYFGTPDGFAYHGYIAETHNALEAEPTFATVTGNDPEDPLYPQVWQSGYDLSYFDNGGDEVTLIRVMYGPEGDLWASFVKDMCPGGNLETCTWDYAEHADSRFQGAVARFVHSE